MGMKIINMQEEESESEAEPEEEEAAARPNEIICISKGKTKLVW